MGRLPPCSPQAPGMGERIRPGYSISQVSPLSQSSLRRTPPPSLHRKNVSVLTRPDALPSNVR